MKVLMLCEYFPPYDFGGSEWSTFYLAKGLKIKGIDPIILTPNYGKAKKRQTTEGIKIIRFPFYKKTGPHKQLTPYWHTNNIWFIYTSLITLFYSITTKADVIHVQGKYFLPAAIFSKILFGKKVVFTTRDYILLCPLGMCLLHHRRPCSFKSFIKFDIPTYINLYLPKASRARILLQTLLSIRARVKSEFLKYFLKKVDKKISLSEISKRIYEDAGIKDFEVIPNSFDFSKKSAKSAPPIIPQLTYAGRLTIGKGISILFEAMPAVLKAYPNTKLIVAGTGFLKKELTRYARKHNFKGAVKFIGYIDHENLLKHFLNSTCTVMPSVWPEPFGRVALESLAVGTPVIVSNRAGISEQLENRKWGRVIAPKASDVASGIIDTIKNNTSYRNNIRKSKRDITKIWSSDVIDSYSNVYNSIVK